MHGMVIDGEYPTGAVGGADFLTRAARGEIIEQGPDGPVVRPEKVLITERFVDMDDPVVGQICIGERTVRHLAHYFGMVDGWRVERIADDNHALRAELVGLSTEVAQLRAQNRRLEEAANAKPVEKVWLALDGTEHASRRAAMEVIASKVGVELVALADAVPMPLEPPLEANR